MPKLSRASAVPFSPSAGTEVVGNVEQLAWGFDAARLIEFVHGASAEKLRDALTRFEAPTLVVRGEHSELLTVEQVRNMGALLRDMSYAEVAGAAHDLGVQQPEAVAVAVRGFLQN